MAWLRITKVPGKLGLGWLLVGGFALLAAAGCGGGGGSGGSEPVAGVQSGTTGTLEPSVVVTGSDGVVRDGSSGSSETNAPPGEAPGESLPGGDLAVGQGADTGDPDVETGAPVGQEDTGFVVDAVARRVHLPGIGWIEEKEFWRIYYREPQLLPGDMDHQALAQFGYQSELDLDPR